ncbi:site-specific DNA-methyltransferase [Burkholderia cenocepacia]|nr:site-specific DNA-methyltransferase [Burkholderia cenocepacia]RQU21029.1 site-specific DNA-methyltransferase [Burkholderia cenocepacia]
MGAATLLLGDCRDVLKTIADRSIDAIVTDPPYEIGFMGRDWDRSGVANDVAVWAECLRVLKPGGHLLAFSGARTYHRMACAIEDAGFELRDQIMWIYGSGFPKSKNLDGDWNGWGTALKPAHEPICVARKPLVGTVEANVLAHGTGALNIDACRVPTDDKLGGGAEKETTVEQKGNDGWTRPWMNDEAARAAHAERVRGNVEKAEALGRWPANVIHDGSPEVLEAFVRFGEKTSGKPSGMKSGGKGNAFGHFNGGIPVTGFGDSGSAAHFFYCAKATRADRNEGVGGSDAPAVASGATMREREDADWPARNGNHHPTVKPTDLMAYLCRLVTPPGGTVLDPFMGSGSTGKACVRERFGFVGIDLALEYIDIARARIEHELSRVAAAAADREALAHQRDLFADAESATACASAYGLCE